jgi:plastocyanin
MKRAAFIVTIILGLALATYAGPAGKYTEIAVTNGGAVSGTVKFTGAAPPPEKLKVDKDLEVCGKGGEKASEALLISASKGVKNVVVTLEGITQGKKLPPKTATLDQRNCTYTPHVLVAPAGSQLNLLNGDGVMHNVHAYSMKNTPFNESIPAAKKSVKTMPFSEVVKMGCDVHKWMSAWVVVVDHPYYAITDEHGGFKITDIPPGKYVLRAWHESLGKVDKEVVIGGGQSATVDFQMSRTR